MTISNLTKMAESYPNGRKTLWEKEKLFFTSNFSFTHSVFKRLLSEGRQKVSLCGNELNMSQFSVFVFESVENISRKRKDNAEYQPFIPFKLDLTHSLTMTPFDAPGKQAL